MCVASAAEAAVGSRRAGSAVSVRIAKGAAADVELPGERWRWGGGGGSCGVFGGVTGTARIGVTDGGRDAKEAPLDVNVKPSPLAGDCCACGGRDGGREGGTLGDARTIPPCEEALDWCCNGWPPKAALPLPLYKWPPLAGGAAVLLGAGRLLIGGAVGAAPAVGGRVDGGYELP